MAFLCTTTATAQAVSPVPTRSGVCSRVHVFQFAQQFNVFGSLCSRSFWIRSPVRQFDGLGVVADAASGDGLRRSGTTAVIVRFVTQLFNYHMGDSLCSCNDVMRCNTFYRAFLQLHVSYQSMYHFFARLVDIENDELRVYVLFACSSVRVSMRMTNFKCVLCSCSSVRFPTCFSVRHESKQMAPEWMEAPSTTP